LKASFPPRHPAKAAASKQRRGESRMVAEKENEEGVVFNQN